MAAITMEQPKYLSRGGDLNTRLNCPQILVPVSDGQVINNEDLDYEEIEDIDSESYHSEGDDIAEYWDPYLYQLQQQAPKPEKVICQRSIVNRPSFYGDEYHGSITREDTAKLLGQEDGRYLVRKGLSQSGTYSLSFVYKGCVRHYHLHYENGEHFVGDTSFENMEDLVTDGLITLYMEDHNVEEYLRTARESTEVRRSMIVPGLETIPENRMDENLENRDMPPPLPPRSYRNSTKLSLISEEGEMEGRISPGGGIYTNVTFNKSNETTSGNNKDSFYTDSYHYEKQHNFKIHTFYSMPWCDYCKNFLWGLRSQGFKCKDCGYISHKQCKDSAPSDCKPTRQRVKRVYGVDLTTVVKMYGTKIPLIVKECIEEIEKRGVDLDGIYRVPGKAAEILQIKKMFDEEMHGDFTNFEDLHAIAGALKLYFRELPIPLITFDNYDLALIAARCSTIEETMETVKVILSRLPLAHYNSLRVLIKHLHKVQEHKLKNRMDSKNLAVIFAPSIMRPPTNQDQLIAMMKLPEQKKITEILITNYSILFR